MPSAMAVSFDEDFISDRLLTFRQNGLSNGRGSFNEIGMLRLPTSAQKSLLNDDGCLAMTSTSVQATRNSPTHSAANGYAATTSSNLASKYMPDLMNSGFSTPNPGTKILDGYHSLQNSPFYNHHHVSCLPILKRQLETSCVDCSSQRVDAYSNGLECPLMMHRGPPQRELFPSTTTSRYDDKWLMPVNANCTGQAPGLQNQDRLVYNALAQKQGFIVGGELERIKENSRRLTSHTYGRISAHFRNRYGETEAKTKASYMQLGVRVPSKDHVSEIVGKGGQKIKLIREETGALITTPGEYEDHVFIIEAPPDIALYVAEMITSRAQEITQSKVSANERRRGSTSSIPGTTSLFSMNSTTTLSSSGGRLVSQSPDNIPSGFVPSPVTQVKTTGTSESAFHFNNGLSSCNNGGGSSGRLLLARSKIAVPQEMVGKIIGTQGSIITTIQKDTLTEIKSPPKEAARGPSATSDFEISAYQSHCVTSSQIAECQVQQAKQLIGHLVMRQFERRASEESEDASGGLDTLTQKSVEEDNNENGSATSRTSKNNRWMWPDVTQMDSTEAREVLDRILAESKNKTRRAKELAVATAATNGGSVPTSPGVAVNGGFGNEFFPLEETVTSLHNSPFHQNRVPMSSLVAQQNAYSPASESAPINLLSEFLSKRRIPNAEFQNSMGSSITPFWPNNTNHPFSMARHSFSAEGNGNLTQSNLGIPRRHTMASDLVGHHQIVTRNLAEDMTKESCETASSTNTTEEAAFELIQTLNSLCLSNEGPSVYRPGDPEGFTGHIEDGNRGSSSSIWPTKTFFLSCGGSDGLSDGSANSDAVLRSIWADAPTNGTSESETYFSNLELTPHPPSSPGGALSTTSPSSKASNRCGAIGEGRRRGTPPTTTPMTLNTASSIPAV